MPSAVTGTYASEHVDSEPLYRSAFVWILALVLVGPQLGMGRAALDLVISKAASKPISYTFFGNQSESVSFQLQIAEAARLIDKAQPHAYRAAADIDDAATTGSDPDYRITDSRH